MSTSPASSPPDSCAGAQIRTLLLDIEGTTTSVEFVYGTLFPYVRAHLREFLKRHRTADLCDTLEMLRREHAADREQHRECPPWNERSDDAELEPIAAYVDWLMDRDRKSSGLKQLQGRIWEAGYASGELRGHVYPDVPSALARWRRQGREICIFSSGSVFAQKLLFAHSDAGDLTTFFHAQFDTTTGPKIQAESYRRIGAALGMAPGAILFLSDTVSELDAARDSGMRTLLTVRPGWRETDAHNHPIIKSFDEVLP